jgi:8-amino-7-oxononanoate synthase
VDEAHATGVHGKGRGLVQENGLVSDVFARVHTFGKALGCHGAAVAGSQLLRHYLINFSRAFIYTTALPLKSLVAIHQAYQLLKESRPAIDRLEGLIGNFRTEAALYPAIRLIDSKSPVQCILAAGNEEAKALAGWLQENGFDVRPILSPTVAKGKERLRICIHAFNTPVEIQKILALISKFFEKKTAV